MVRVSPHPSLLVGSLLVALLAPVTLAQAQPASAPTPSAHALRGRAAVLFERRDRSSRTGGVPMEALRADLIELAGQLEAARLDSLAAEARIDAARVLERLARRPEAEQQLNLAIADALRAGDQVRQIRGRLLLASMRVPADPAGGLRIIDETLSAARPLNDDDLMGLAFATRSQALVELGQFQEGLQASRHAAAHYAAAGSEQQELLSLCQCSQALRFLTRHPEARAITDSVIARARAGQDGLALARALTESASMYRTTRRYPEALAAANEAIELDRRRGDLLHARNSRMTRARVYQSMGRPEASAADLDTMMASPDVQRSLSLLVRVAGLRARSLIAMGRAAEADTMLASVTRRFERYRAGLADEEDHAGIGEHAGEAYMAWTRVKLALERPPEAWEACERGRGASIERRLGTAGVPALAELQERLRQTHSALLEYDVVDPAVGSVFLVSGAGVHGFPMKKPMTVGDLNAVLDEVSAPGNARAPDSAGIRLSQTLLTDVWPLLDSGIQRLFVVPPSKLESLPFEALPAPGTGAAGVVGDRFSVSYVASAGALLALDRRNVPPRGITVVADPVVDARQPAIATLGPELRGAVLRPLPGARHEAELLAGPGTTLLLGRQATLNRLIASRPAALLHIATHAFDDPKSASHGGLVFAGPDAMLTPSRLESLTVAADLVTLSACGTLGTANYQGEGAFGLTRAFLASGSRSVLSSRWNVSDRGAARFMEEFYAALKAGVPRDESVTRARMRLQQESFPPRDCWAFMLTGIGDRPLAQWAAAPGKSAPVPK